MCGILGYTQNQTRLSSHVLAAAISELDHRGPDQAGQFTSNDIALGAVRLSIRDVNHGEQPMFSQNRDVVVIFNGEIYNHTDLRAQLEWEGYKFDTHCDTEVVLKAFLRWGNDCFARLRGMFAVGIWIQSERRLLLARDRMGIKPLYYCQQDGELFFGSELKCIFAHPGVRRHIDLDGLNCFLSLNWVPGPYTLVEGIRKLMPGELLEWQGGECVVQSYLPRPSSSVIIPRTIEDACEELDYLLREAVKEELVSDVPLGVWLSGGLDSSSIVHYAASEYPGRLKTFSITFKGRSFDESEFMKEVSAHFGTQHFDFDLNPDSDLVGAIEQMAYYSDEPSADAGALPVWFLAQMTRKHVTVILSGEGSDELFGGYLTYQANRYCEIARMLPAPVRRLALMAANCLPVSDDKISFEYKLKRFLRGSLMSPELAHVYWNGTFSEEEKERIFRYADAGPLSGVVGTMNGAGLQKYLAFDQRYYLADDILYKVDRMSMAHSLEVRPPFLDSRVVDFAARLPEQFKIKGSTSKYVLRKLMNDKLPQSVLRRPKIGFDIPVHDWFRNELRPLLLETLSEEAVTASGLFDWPALKGLIDAHLDRKANLGYHLWGLMVLFIWMKKWKIEGVPLEERIPSRAVEIFDAVGSSSSRLASSSSSA